MATAQPVDLYRQQRQVMPSPADFAKILATYAWGECTWFVAKTTGWIPGGLGDAKDWLVNGKAKGMTTSNTPVVGDVVVFNPGQQGALDHGHVALVTKVNPDWTFDVTEMHFPGINQQTSRSHLSPKAVAGFLVSPLNDAPGPTAFGSSVPGDSRQVIAESYFKAGWQNDGIAGKEGTYTGPSGVTVAGVDFAALGKILSFVTDPKEWWRIAIVLIALVMIFIGVTGYFAPRAAKVAPIPV